MKLVSLLAATAAAALLSPAPLMAQTEKSQPPIAPALPQEQPPVDRAFPGVMTLDVDASDTGRAIFKVEQRIPLAGLATSGRDHITLLYPQWLPGKHAPRGDISGVAGLQMWIGGVPVQWTRDPLDVYAFKVPIPQGSNDDLTIMFQYLAPLRSAEGRVNVTPAMMNLQWEQVALYPAGWATRKIRVKPSLVLPTDWTGVAAMDGQTNVAGQTNRITWSETDFETMVDSPLFAGPHYARWELGQNVTLNVWADEAQFLAAKPEHIETHRKLVAETIALFGSRPFDRYEFLLGLTEQMGGIGLEHHRSSENTRETDYFVKWDDNGSERGLLPHEFVHSWNGKYRRPAKLWTPDYRTPMQNNLLWVYEGQTSYWDLVLAARSGMQSRDMVLGEWARFAGFYSEQAGRVWRSVEDTTLDPIIAARKPKPWASWHRGEDYYNEGSLIWLEADVTIRRLSNGRKSLDDFARLFFGGRDGDWGEKTYEFEDIVTTLNTVQPFDWATFLNDRMRTANQPAPVRGIDMGGYELVWKAEPNIFDKERMREGKQLDLSHSLGMIVDGKGVITQVMWDSPAFGAGLVNGMKILAVGGVEYNDTRLKAAITAAASGSNPPIELLIERNGRFTAIQISYAGGLRYPHLVPKAGVKDRLIDRLLMPRLAP